MVRCWTIRSRYADKEWEHPKFAKRRGKGGFIRD